MSKIYYIFLLIIFFPFLLINCFTNFADINCGQKLKYNINKIGKIVGGTEAFRGEFPWMVSLTRRGGHFCGGSLINNKYVLTAGHCLCTGVGLETLKASHIKITVAQHYLNKISNGAYQMAIKTILIHPEYICNKPKNDIAILELDEKVRWSDIVSPACLPNVSNKSTSIDNLLATVSGWGWTNEDSSKGGRAKALQKAKVYVIENEKCRQWYRSQGKKTVIEDTQICAGHEQGGIDSCWADSGGPLMVNTGKDNQIMIVGIVSTGIGCARPYLPGIYTRISEYIPWIKNIITH